MKKFCKLKIIRYQSFDPSKKPSLLGKLGCDEDEIEDILNCIYKHGLNFVGTHFKLMHLDIVMQHLKMEFELRKKHFIKQKNWDIILI